MAHAPSGCPPLMIMDYQFHQHPPPSACLPGGGSPDGTGLVEVRCVPLDSGGTRIDVSYAMTALTPAGEASLDAYGGKAFADMIEEWRAAIEQRLPLLLATRIR
jgi:hypothetical protein